MNKLLNTRHINQRKYILIIRPNYLQPFLHGAPIASSENYSVEAFNLAVIKFDFVSLNT